MGDDAPAGHLELSGGSASARSAATGHLEMSGRVGSARSGATGHLELSGSAGGVVGALAGAALTATISVHAEGVVMTAGGAVIPPGTSPSTATLLTYLDRLLTMPAESLAALAFAVQQFLTGVISDWRAEFESAGVLVLPLLLILVVRRMKP